MDLTIKLGEWGRMKKLSIMNILFCGSNEGGKMRKEECHGDGGGKFTRIMGRWGKCEENWGYWKFSNHKVFFYFSRILFVKVCREEKLFPSHIIITMWLFLGGLFCHSGKKSFCPFFNHHKKLLYSCRTFYHFYNSSFTMLCKFYISHKYLLEFLLLYT